jgi:lipopolysaccharide/colanic/teichoic acid biosynthesis glycosyltransferase
MQSETKPAVYTKTSTNTNYKAVKKGVYERYIKRRMDFVLALIALTVLSPLMLFLAILIKVKLGSPVIFKQERPGLNEKIFTLYKFRTMTDAKDENGNLLPDSLRLTKFGKFLRSTSLDELPSLWNIIRGELAVIGPRPLLVEYLSLYNEQQRRRHEVRPGLSGLAQVNGRNAISWEEKFDLDLQYIDNITFLSDWKIILLTIKKVFQREGICSKNSATAEKFQDSIMEEANI